MPRVTHRRLRCRRACVCPDPKTVTAPPILEPVTDRSPGTVQIYSLHSAAKKVLATLDRKWEGLARHQVSTLRLDHEQPWIRGGAAVLAGQQRNHYLAARLKSMEGDESRNLTNTTVRNGGRHSS